MRYRRRDTHQLEFPESLMQFFREIDRDNQTGKHGILISIHILKGLISQNSRLRVGFFAQHHVDALDLTMSAVSFMAKTYPGRTDEEYRRQLGAFGITGTTGLQKMAVLSGGQKSRVAFACLALTQPHILVLDAFWRWLLSHG